ncbi:hypothetical protein AB0M20_37230 [Actinoplanes sp. NPDC051633]|uniref:hypothetical protein n=1 Tax=Actinoplanes sp. NPDC051633 TaxID=3155670 RepID=UPI00342D3168
MSADDDLLADLRRVAGLTDPVPAYVRAAARAAFETRDMDARLAELVADSAEHAGFEAVRQVAEERLLSFETPDAQVEVTVRAEGAGWTLMGQVFGAGPGTAVLETGTHGSVPIELDALGRFLVADVPGGPVRLRLRPAGASDVLTSWVTL